MEVKVYKSCEPLCQEEYVLETNREQYIIFVFCDECGYKHDFEEKETFTSHDELWKYISENVGENEFDLHYWS